MEKIIFSPRHDGQRKVAEIWDKSQAIVITGPAGTGKTSVALGLALTREPRVILCRPAVAVDEDLGFTPGTIEEKLAPWMAPFLDVLGDLSNVRHLAKLKNVETVSIGMLGGRTIKGATLICDEAQNCSYAQLKMALTRIGEKGRVVLCGDYEQTQLKTKPNPLRDIADRLSLVTGAAVINFLPQHQQRSGFVTEVLKVL